MTNSNEIKDFIESLSGDYVRDLNSITDKIQELFAQDRMIEVNELMAFADKMMEKRKQNAEEEDYRSLDLAYTYDEETIKDMDNFYKRLEASMSAIFDEKWEVAQDLLSSIPTEVFFIKEAINKLKEGKSIKSFQSLTDEVLYRLKHSEDSSEIVGPELQMYLSFYGAFLQDRKNYGEAEKYFSLALKANPIDCASLLSMSKIKRIQNQEDEAKSLNHKVFNEAYQITHFAEAFANEAYFLYKEGNPNLALAFNFMALEFEEDNISANGNLLLLKNKYPQAKLASKRDYNEYMKNNKIKGQPDEDTISILKTLGEKAEEENNLELALQIYTNLDQLIHDESIHRKIHELLPRYQEEEGEFIQHLGGESYSHHQHGDCCDHDHSHHHNHGHCCNHESHHNDTCCSDDDNQDFDQCCGEKKQVHGDCCGNHE